MNERRGDRHFLLRNTKYREKKQPNAELFKPPLMKDYLTMVRVIDSYFEFEPKYWVEGLITKAIVVCVFNPYDLEQFDLCRYR